MSFPCKHECSTISSDLRPPTGADHGSPGTVAYMSHELLKGAPYGQPADLWACGVTLLEIWTGTLTVFKDLSDNEIKERIVKDYSPPESLGPAFDTNKAKLDRFPYVQHHLQQVNVPSPLFCISL